ncbi:response regulator [Cupriavidus basilensis]
METTPLSLDFADSEPVVFVVEDDESVRNSLVMLFRSVRLHAEAFATAAEFLSLASHARPACLVLDVRLPGISGLDLQREMAERDLHLPIVFISGHGTIPLTVKAMKALARSNFFGEAFGRGGASEAGQFDKVSWTDWTARHNRTELDKYRTAYVLRSPRGTRSCISISLRAG